jgi:hypothetical protein
MGDAGRRGLGQHALQGDGSGVVWGDGAVQAPSTPVVPMLIASWPSACQIWRVKVATEVLPLVPVTATITAGWAPNHRAAA